MQVLLSDAEYEQLRVTAQASNVSVGEWVRRAIRTSMAEPQTRHIEAKLAAVREALSYYGPTGDIEQMNSEIELGYGSGLR
jgi:hypothetical protein